MKRRGASRCNPPDQMLRIARERTRDITKAWTDEIAWGAVDLQILVESAYMQGLNDMTEAVIRQGWIPSAETKPFTLGDLP